MDVLDGGPVEGFVGFFDVQFKGSPENPTDFPVRKQANHQVKADTINQPGHWCQCDAHEGLLTGGVPRLSHDTKPLTSLLHCFGEQGQPYAGSIYVILIYSQENLLCK